MADEKLSFTEHLSELRRSLIISLMALLAGFLISFNYSEDILKLLILPMQRHLSLSLSYPFFALTDKGVNAPPLVFLAPAEAFWIHLKISLTSGFILALPVILYQTWRFVSPGLMQTEKRYVGPFVIAGVLLFLVGISFCFAVVLPFAMRFLLTYKTASLTPMISVGNYIDFCLKFMLAFGVVFELPVVILMLTRMGVVTPQALSKNRKYAILFAFVIAAVLTPTPDAFNQTLMAVPIILLYEAGVLASRLFHRRRP